MFISTQSPGVCTCVASLCRGIWGTIIVPLILLTCTGCWQVLCKVSSFHLSQFITIQVQGGDKAKCRLLFLSPPLFSHPYCLIHSHGLFRFISPSCSLCSLMFYLISHNKASLWTAINCVWIFPLRRNRELSERAPVPQAAFILMQRSIAIFIAGSITHVTVVLWAGATSQKEAWQHHHRGLQNDTALIAEQGRRGLGGGVFFFGGETGCIQIRNCQALAFARLFTLWLRRSCRRYPKSRRKH